MKITGITPTGDRQLAFALCQRWMSSQTRKLDQWLVVDDGKVPQQPAVEMEYVRREPKANDAKFTLNANLQTAVPLVTGDLVLILEDDEYYAPNYVACMEQGIGPHLLVGLSHSRYYHLPSGKYLQIGNATHASLAETGFNRAFMPQFSHALLGDAYLDIRLWQAARNQGVLYWDKGNPIYLGIKGLPGRPGIGLGHSETLYRRADSPDRSILKQWVPQDWQIYMDVLSGALNEANYREYFKWA